MKTIIVDDEAIMLHSFLRQSRDIKSLEVIGLFQDAESAEKFARSNRVDIAILDILLPCVSGIELAKRLRAIRPDILIVFISAYEGYIRQCNIVDADYFIAKPYNSQTLKNMVAKMELLATRQAKEIYIKMFGGFAVYKNDTRIDLRGKSKEVLALIATRRGKEISNEEIYATLWPNRQFSNKNMNVYYNVIQRLKNKLQELGLSDLLISTARGQLLNVAIVDCDFYDWQDDGKHERDYCEGKFLAEYTWGEQIFADILRR